MITVEQLRPLFSILIELDAEGGVLSASDTAQKYLPSLCVGSRLLEVVSFVRPAGVTSWDDLKTHVQSLLLVVSKGRDFALRGQLIAFENDGQHRYVFCGSPWLAWISENQPELKVTLNDFGPQDSQFDQVFILTTEKRMVADLEDLNQQLKVAQSDLERAQATKNALFARMSHEMRTPLHGILSAISLLSERELDGEMRQVLTLAQRSADNMMYVINYVLDLAKIEAAGAEKESVLFTLNGLLDEVSQILKLRAEEKNLSLRWRKESAVTDLQLGDQPKLRQCLLNFATNAIKFTYEGFVEIRAVAPQVLEGDAVRFEVEDSGVGISKEDQAKVFDPFWSKDNDSSTGTGLGLDICRRAVALMDGEIGVADAPGGGSLFWLEVPLEPGDERLLQTEAANKIDASLAQFEGKVLLVDDNQTNLILGTKLLEKMGVQVHTAHDGLSAVFKVAQHHYDLVFMDLNMPGIDGVKTTQNIRLMEPTEGSIPIVALTAYASSAEEQRCLDAGMNGYLTKPIVREQLAKFLTEYLTAQPASFSLDDPTPQAVATPESARANDASLDLSVLEALRGEIGIDGLAVVVGRFVTEARARCESLQSALHAGAFKDAQREAHTLGSSCGSLGLMGLAGRFRDMEQSLLEQTVDFDAGEVDFMSIERDLSEGLRDLDAFIGQS